MSDCFITPSGQFSVILWREQVTFRRDDDDDDDDDDGYIIASR